MDASYCPYCSFYTTNIHIFVKHLFEAHCFENNFFYICGISSCTYEFTSGSTYATFLTHCNRKHNKWRETLSQSTIVNGHCLYIYDSGITNGESKTSSATVDDMIIEDPDVMSVITKPQVNEEEDIVLASARFLITLKEKYRLTQASLDFVLDSVDDIIKLTCQRIGNSVQKLLNDAGSDVSLSSCFPITNPFLNLRTEYQQTKFYKEYLGLVEPVTIELGKSYKYQQSGSTQQLVEVKDTFQYIPLLKNLEMLLNNSEFFKEVTKPHQRNDWLLGDFCDASLYKHHPIFSCYNGTLVLEFITYYDEVEVTNPLGSSKGKHKLALFYYTLGNLHPMLRASLKSIQLIATVTYPNLKEYGYERILKPFIDDMNKLSKGYPFQINKTEIIVKGAVLVMLADTQAAHSIGGFKVGVGFALRKCRDCLATGETMKHKYREDMFVLRTPATYDYHCSLLSGHLAAADSVTYGVNFQSTLNSLDYFHVANNQIPQDVMHILLEGVVPYTLKLMLHRFIFDKKYFTLDMLNNQIIFFAFSRSERKDKPSPLIVRMLQPEGNINQTAAQMWNFAIYLPLMVGDQIPNGDSNWECYLLLLDILKICMARILSIDLIQYLKVLIEMYLRLFCECYPEANIIPKQHYLVHLPSQALKLGPYTCSMCMRMEAKNSYIKKIAQLGNFKNIPLSVARRHQKLMCAFINSSDFFERSISSACSDYSSTLSHETQNIQDEIMMNLPNLDRTETTLYRCDWVEWRGSKYFQNDFVLYDFQDDDLPQFGKILDILMVEKNAFLYLHTYVTRGIDYHYHSYVIEPTLDKKIVFISNKNEVLAMLHPLLTHSLRSEPRRIYIVTKRIVVKI